MKNGVIVNKKYDKMGNVVYIIETDRNEKIESIPYSKFDNSLKEQKKITFDIIDGKAKIFNDKITKVATMNKKDYLTLVVILFIIVILIALYLLNIINQIVLFIIIISAVVLCALSGIIKMYSIYKKGEIHEAIVIDKEQVYTASDHSSRLAMKYHYNLTIRLSDGTEIKGNIPFDESYKNIKIGDKIKVKVYKGEFILTD